MIIHGGDREDIESAISRSPSGRYLVYQTVQRYDPSVRREKGQTVRHGQTTLSPVDWLLKNVEHAEVDLENGTYSITDHGDESITMIHDHDRDLDFEFYPHDYFAGSARLDALDQE